MIRIEPGVQKCKKNHDAAAALAGDFGLAFKCEIFRHLGWQRAFVLRN